MFLSVILAGFFAGFSPFWGLLIIIAYSYKYYLNNNLAWGGIFLAAALISIWGLAIPDPYLASLDAIWGVGITAYLYFFFFQKSHSHQNAFMAGSLNAFVYGFARQALFSQVISKQISESSKQSLVLLQEMFSSNPEMQELAQMSTEASLKFFQNFSVAIWFLTIFFALYFGSHWFAFRIKSFWKQDSFNLPYWSVYGLIAAMLFFIFPVTRNLGSNLLLIISAYFFVQGTAVVFYFWKLRFPANRFLWFFLLSCLLINYVFIMFLLALGLVDLWLMFRQKYQSRLDSQ